MPKAVALVVPCFNEAARLDAGAFAALSAGREGLRLIFVDDGSTDGTPAMLERLRAGCRGPVEILRLERNSGKAEAVRRGLLAALATGDEVVGYTDADLATPGGELLRMMADMEARPIAALLGARVRLLGTRIERRAARHYLGRVFATIASLALGVDVYDTQCGAKLFLRGPPLEAALARPFRSRWVFDVELLERLLRGGASGRLGTDEMREFPLQAWRDVGGSTLRTRAMLRAGLQLLRIAARALAAGPAGRAAPGSGGPGRPSPPGDG